MTRKTYSCAEANKASASLLWLALIIALVLMACGCKMTGVKYNTVTHELRAHDWRAGMHTEAEVTATISTNGTSTVTIKAKSDPSIEAIKAAASGVAEGLMKGAGKAVIP